MQVGGLVLDDAGIQAVRWVLPRGDMTIAPDCSIQCNICASTLPFVKPYIQRTIDAGDNHPGILLYIFTGQARYYVGRYVIRHWKDTLLVRAPQTGSKVPPTPRGGVLQVLQGWNLDHTMDAVVFPVEDGSIFVPTCILYMVLDERVITWCTAQNRFGPSCLVHTHDGYPTPGAFRLSRRIACQYRYPVLLLFTLDGPTQRYPGSTELDHYGLQCILFQPGTGDNCRVHFYKDANGKVWVGYGEPGDSP